MSSSFARYNAIIPVLFIGMPEVQTLIGLLADTGVLEDRGGDIHFEVEDCDGEALYGDASYYFPSYESHWLDRSTLPLLRRLVDTGKVCLVYSFAWSSGGGWEDDETRRAPSMDTFLSLVERIPTLILQEILAQRLEEG